MLDDGSPNQEAFSRERRLSDLSGAEIKDNTSRGSSGRKKVGGMATQPSVLGMAPKTDSQANLPVTKGAGGINYSQHNS